MAPDRPLKHRRDGIFSLGAGTHSPCSPSLVQSSSPGYRARPFESHHSVPRKQIGLNSLLTQQKLENSNYSDPSSRAPISEISEAVHTLEDDSNVQDSETDNSLDQVIMAVDMRDKGTVGCCYYVAKEEKLYMMDDVKYGGIDVIDAR